MTHETEDLAQPVDTGGRLQGVKELMKYHQVSVYLVPTEDAHGSEYIGAADARREYMTGFTGSAGTALVLLDQPQSLLFTDGRYFNQAAKQLHPSYWKLMKQGLDGVPTWQEYLVNAAEEATQPTEDPPGTPDPEHPKGLRIGIDPTLVSAKEAEELSAKLNKYSAQLVSLRDNLVDIQWGTLKPPRQKNPIKILGLEYCGRAVPDKLANVRERMKSLGEEKKAVLAGMVVSALDEVAWCLNLRGTDIAYNPVFFSYLWIGADEHQTVVLFVEPDQLDDSLKKYLADNGVETKPYSSIWDFLQRLGDEEGGLLISGPPSEQPNVNVKAKTKTKAKVLISPATSLAVENELGGVSKTLQARSPLQELKAIKNATEIEGFRRAHIRDGAALVTYFAWLEEFLTVTTATGEGQTTNTNTNTINEYDAALRLESLRKEFGGEFFQGLSFTTISSTGKNAAIIHYSPDPKDSAVIDKDQVYLCDSGAQYLDGTTDVTRTWHFGTPTDEERRANTRVLQGHIHLAQMRFPDKTTGYQLDAFARQYLWQDGLDYRHGTGHGVGHFLNVHEGPQGIGTRLTYDAVSLKPGMTVSNEPGYYKDECFGIRIESVVVVKEIKKRTRNDDGDGDGDDDGNDGGAGAGDPKNKPFLGFDTLTLCPIQVQLLDRQVLSGEQVGWLNAYHQEVLDKLTPCLGNHPRALQWLVKQCQPIL